MGLVRLFPTLAALLIFQEVSKCSALKLTLGEVSEKGGEEKEAKSKHDWYAQWKMSWKGQKFDNATREELKALTGYYLRDRAGQTWKKMNRDGTVPNIWVDGGDVKVLVHGYVHRTNKDGMKQIREQLITDIGFMYGKENSSLNIILMDWTSLGLAHSSHYKEIVKNVPYAGNDLSELLSNLTKSEKIKDVSQVHIIGFAMGAHVAAVAGQQIQHCMEGKKIARITGLDPCGPGFVTIDGESYNDEATSLDKNDAAFVDIIHCNMGKYSDYDKAVTGGQFGSSIQSGHVDFYPNGGEFQRRSKCARTDEHVDQACSQRKCNEYFANSITSKMVACPCDDWKLYATNKCDCTEESGGHLMGDHCSTAATGRHYLRLPPVNKDDPVQDATEE